MRGTVARLDPDGWGVIHDTDGFDHPFHCTALADGTRRVDPGTEVSFELSPGRQGRWEATTIQRS